MAENSSITLQTVVSEFRNISPELTKAFVFKKNGEILASIGDNISEDRAKLAVSFDEIADQAEVIGGVEILTIHGVSSQIEITCTNDSYLVTVASPSANEKVVKALTRVIMPTVIKLLDQVKPALPDSPPSDVTDQVVKQVEQAVQPPEEPKLIERLLIERLPDVPVASPEQSLPKPPVNQFVVEKIGGLLVAPDAVRVDTEVVAKWSDLYGDREITHVKVETLAGKTVICKFKPMRAADRNLKGKVQIPEKILRILRTGEGKLVMVKPFILKLEEERS